MRVFKPTYSKLLPEGAKIISRKNGKFAKFKNSKGHTTETRLTKKGNKILLETVHWHVEFEDNQGIRRHLKAFTNERASHRLADKIEELLSCHANNRQPDDELCKWLEQVPGRIRDELIKFTLLDGSRTAAGKTLTDLIEEFEKSLRAKERTTKYIGETISLLKHLSEGCAFRYWSDITPTKVEEYLKGLRDNGISYRRSNAYLTAAKQFCTWMVKSGFATESPLRHLVKLNEELDRRRERRALTVDELRTLLKTTQTAPECFRMSGYERYLLYRLASESGLRADEIRTLTVGSFNFDNLTVTVEAGYSKHREKDVLPLREGLATLLKEFFRGRLPVIKAFGGSNEQLTVKTADMVKEDLARAKIEYIDESGRVFDFHAFRHTFITNLRYVKGRVAQSLARHKSSQMTDRYTHIQIHDERSALESLPDLSLPSRENQQALKTGTDSKALDAVGDKSLSKSCFLRAPIRSNVESSGEKNVDTVEKTTLCINNMGARRTENPCVGGSIPPLPIRCHS